MVAATPRHGAHKMRTFSHGRSANFSASWQTQYRTLVAAISDDIGSNEPWDSILSVTTMHPRVVAKQGDVATGIKEAVWVYPLIRATRKVKDTRIC